MADITTSRERLESNVYNTFSNNPLEKLPGRDENIGNKLRYQLIF